MNMNEDIIETSIEVDDNVELEDPVIVCEDNGGSNSPEKGEEDGDSSLRERLEVTMEDDDKSYIGEMESGGDSVLGESINEDDKQSLFNLITFNKT